MFDILSKLIGGGIKVAPGNWPDGNPNFMGSIIGNLMRGEGIPREGEPIGHDNRAALLPQQTQTQTTGPSPSQAQAPQVATPKKPGGIFGMISDPATSDNLIAMGAKMMQAGAPSKDPAAGSFMGAVGQGMDAYGQAGRDAADTALKRSLTQSQIGNNDSSTAHNKAQTALVQGQADVLGKGPPVPTGGAPIFGNPALTPGAPKVPNGAPSASPAPSAGAVFEGYRFKGGNPNDPNAWEKV